MLKKRSVDKRYKYGFNDGDVSFFKTNKGLNKEIIIEVSKMKGEPS